MAIGTVSVPHGIRGKGHTVVVTFDTIGGALVIGSRVVVAVMIGATVADLATVG